MPSRHMTSEFLPAPTRIAGRVILRYAGILFLVVAALSQVGRIAGIVGIVAPVPGFEPVTLAATVGMALFGVALLLPSGGSLPARPVVIALMILVAVGQLVAGSRATADPFLLLLAALSCAFHGVTLGWRRTVALALPVTLVIVALLVLVKSVPTGTNPDPQSGASAQWALGALVGGLALVAANTARAVGGLLVNRHLPWLVGVSSSVLVLLLWLGVIRSKDNLVQLMTESAATDAASRITQRGQRLLAAVSDGAWTTDVTHPEGQPWDSLLPGVVAVAVERHGALNITRGAARYSGLLDSLARSAAMPSGTLVPLDPPGARLTAVAVRARQPSDPAASVIVLALVDTLFRDILSPPEEVMLGTLRRGTVIAPAREQRRYLTHRSVGLPGIPATLEMWPTRGTLLSARSILPELLLVGGLGFAGLAAVALSAAIRSRRLEYTARQKALLEALATPRYPRFRYEWDVTSGRMMRDPRLLTQLGYAAGMSGGDMTHWRSLIWPADLPQVQAAFDAHVAGSTDAALVQYHVRAADGTWHRWVDRAYVTEWNGEGKPRRVSGLSADLGPAEIDHDLDGELDLRLERAAAQAVDMQALFAADDRLLIASPGADPYIAEANGRVTGLDRLQVASTDEHASLALLWSVARAEGRARGDVKLQGPAGAVRIMDIALLRLGETTDASEILLQARDVTTLRGTERRHIESQRLLLLGRLSGRVAHEINNPLGGLKNAAALLRRLGHNEADRIRYADTIDREVENIAQVVRQLYETLEWGDVSRLDCSVPDVIQTAVQTLTGSRADVTVQVRIDPDARRVAAPEAVVRLVVYTLLRNALNASPGGGTVLITSRRSDSDIILHIDDEGPGVPEELRASLLGKSRAPRQARKQRSDLILGLPFAREVLEVFDGSLDIESTPAGGASFVTRWPATLDA